MGIIQFLFKIICGKIYKLKHTNIILLKVVIGEINGGK